MASQPTFTDLRCEPVQRLETEFDFTLECSARWPTRRMDLRFSVSHLERNRLVVTSLTIAATDFPDMVNASVLKELPLRELTTAVHQWIVNDGIPNGATSEALLARGEDPDSLPSHQWWRDARAQFVEILPASDHGPRKGRPRSRNNDANLQIIAEDYVRLTMAGERAPQAALAELHGLSPAGIRGHVGAAREQGWLAPTNRGARRDAKPGTRLLLAWQDEGAPAWWEWSLSDGDGQDGHG
jgi:hypothetical protein